MATSAPACGNTLEILWRSHDGELDCSLISERLVVPFPDGADALESCDTVVGDEYLCRRDATRAEGVFESASATCSVRRAAFLQDCGARSSFCGALGRAHGDVSLPAHDKQAQQQLRCDEEL